MKYIPENPEHWAHDMRGCPLEDCHGVVDDDCAPPHCCSCGTQLPDGPKGPMALPAPSGRRLQSEIPDPLAPPRLPENVISIERCIFCDTREVVTDMGPHPVFYVFKDEIVERGELIYPIFNCAICSEGWVDHRGAAVEDAWITERNEKYCVTA